MRSGSGPAKNPKPARRAAPKPALATPPETARAKVPVRRPYAVHPGVEMMVEWVASLKAKTGRTLDEWKAHVKACGPPEEAAARVWLKDKLGLGTNTAWWLAERAFQKPGALVDDDPASYLRLAPKYVDEMFGGKKAALRPLYDEALRRAFAVADDVKACPCRTIVPLYRKHVFAQLKPATNSRLDVGLALAKYRGRLPARLVDTGGLAKKDRITHRIEATRLADLDDEVDRWLRIAYDLDV